MALSNKYFRQVLYKAKVIHNKTNVGLIEIISFRQDDYLHILYDYRSSVFITFDIDIRMNEDVTDEFLQTTREYIELILSNKIDE